jgi:hypothetical protein
MRKPNHRLFNLLLLFSLLVGTSISFAADNIKVFTDRNPVRLNESFHLVFEVDNTVSDNPDFTPLQKDFDILNQSQSSQINIINRQQHSSKKWQLTVIAKRAGNLVIPSIHFGNDRSTPSIITVQQTQASEPGQASTDIFLEVDAEPKNPYVQSQVIYTVRLFFAINFNNASLSEPKIAGGEGIVEKLGEDAQYKTQRNGKRFQVLERKYAIFPQQSGDVTIEPLLLDAKISDGRRSRSLFDDFGFLGQSRTRTKRLRSEAIALEVRAIPKTFTGQHWLPAKQLNLQENWSEEPPQFKAGEPATRTLTLLADGLTAGQLPEFSQFPSSSSPQNQGEFKQYPDKPKLDEQGTAQGVISRRAEKVAIIPSEAGNYTLPAIEIPWWNTKTDRMEIARLAARTISVQPADNVPQPVQPNPAPIAIQPTPTDTPIKTPIIQQPTTNHWTWLSLILAIGWLSTIIAWWRTRRKTKSTPKPETLNDKALIKKLKQACHNNDLKQVKEALISFAQMHWQNNAPHSLGGIAPRCDEPLQTEIQALNRLLYCKKAENWQGAGLWKAFKAYYAQTRKSEKTFVDELEPLYKTV